MKIAAGPSRLGLLVRFKGAVSTGTRSQRRFGSAVPPLLVSSVSHFEELVKSSSKGPLVVDFSAEYGDWTHYMLVHYRAMCIIYLRVQMVRSLQGAFAGPFWGNFPG